jgi:hypothetical protein
MPIAACRCRSPAGRPWPARCWRVQPRRPERQYCSTRLRPAPR